MKNIKRIIQFLVVIIGFGVLAILCMEVTFQLWISGGTLLSKPSQQILMTAEYLYSAPNPTPNDVIIDEKSLWLGNYEIICATILQIIPSGHYRWSRWFLNGERVPHRYYYQPGSFIPLDDVYPFNTCLDINKNDLAIGFHLLEIQFKTSPFDTGISYQWAIKIEPSPTPSPTPPTP